MNVFERKTKIDNISLAMANALTRDEILALLIEYTEEKMILIYNYNKYGEIGANYQEESYRKQIYWLDNEEYCTSKQRLIAKFLKLIYKNSQNFFYSVINDLEQEYVDNEKNNSENFVELLVDVNTKTENKPTTNFWGDDDFKIFISHPVTEKIRANQLKKQLEFLGYKCFVAHDDIKPSSSWQDEIYKALKTMDILVSIHYPEFSESFFCQQEIGFALGLNVPIIPLKIDNDPEGFISSIQALPVKAKKAYYIAKEINNNIKNNELISEEKINIITEKQKMPEVSGFFDLAGKILEHSMPFQISKDELEF